MHARSQGHGMAAVADALYVFGGGDSNGSPRTRNVYRAVFRAELGATGLCTYDI
jgi:hypothetical protein